MVIGFDESNQQPVRFLPMEIFVNGAARQVPDNYTAAELIEALGLAGKRVAMEVNREIVPRGEHATHRFQPADKIEVVHAIGGG